MKKTSSVLVSLLWISVATTLVLSPPSARGAAPCDPPIATMVSIQGNVAVLRAGQTQPEPARLNETYCPGDRIQVGDRSRADVQLVNQPVLRLDQNSLITLAGLKDQRASIVDMARGALHFFSRLPRNLEINTAFVNAGVEGTEGLVQVEADQTLITIFEGRVLAANAAGSLPITSGQSAVAARGQAPVLRTVVRPRDAVQWALYYPPVTYFRADDFRGTQPWEGMVRNSLEASNKGDYQRAFDALQSAPADITEPRFYAYRASLLLGVGRVDEASTDLERALKLNPNYADALALQSIVATVQNDKDRALNVAQKAVSADSKSASALTALSYAQQANFDLEGARSSLERAVQADPNNALAWARLAEIHMSFGRLDEALEAAQKAVSLNPDLSRTQMVLGFAHLLRVDTTESKAAFEKAIALDQADSLSRLGLGLAKIRDGNLSQGRADIEVAASLDPNNSLIRSYLGKAYYEEKRSELTDREFATAKELDPKDPTPWFYDAIQKQTTNRPVEALHDMQTAIELNNNRAVYRSQLLLDADLAARSASQARIYSDLGFQQLALVEGWKSVNTDPTNYSAHRFLADSYSILPRHEIARVSELLQSQLLQPLNMTPIQPRLAEANLFLISAGGPSALSFNEFNNLFNRDGLTVQLSSLGGQHDTFSGEGILSGIYKKASFSAGYSHFETNGFRINNDQKDDIANVFLQLELSPATSVQAEYRHRGNERGDVTLRFFPDEVRPFEKTIEDTNTYRLGLRHAFTPNSILLTSFIYQNVNPSFSDTLLSPFGPIDTGIKSDERSIGEEIQHLFRSQYVNITSGGGYVDANARDIFRLSILPFPQSFRRDVNHGNVYLYSYINALKNVTFTAGASGDFFKTEDNAAKSRNQFNPKFGLTWNLFPNTTLRAAVFRALKRTLISNATLEPTQVAGFNQFFDDASGTVSWRYGGAIDQKFTKSIFGGLEFSKRDLTVPFVDPTFATQEVDWKEYLARTYIFWTPHPWLALRAEYQFERFKRDKEFVFDVRNVNTHRVPLGINFFHPSGFSAALKTTYVNQSGKFEPGAPGVFVSGNDDFWLVDAAISYRLPKRYGLITVGANNLFDKSFKFRETDPVSPSIQPRRFIFGRLTLAFP